MTPERWQQVKEICYAALDCEPDRRTALLADLCGSDDELRREAEVMLADALSDETVRLAAPRGAYAGAGALDYAAAGASHAGWTPEVIGSFRVIRVVGEGGMGVVYEAQQQEPSRTVALKIIRPGLATPEVLRRFRQETQALGRLQHPGIAQIYEAGTADTPFGPQPYFAMEFIRGTSLKRYVEQHKVSLRHRLELMARICDAVHHAHQRGLIHRDLKPSNILIDDYGQPKILDFGVARLTDSDVKVTRHTDQGQLIGTLTYMSPEQVLADPLELDTRSDVYALGVILYELLAGRLPYDVGTRIHEAVRTIQQEDPKRLSSISRVFRGDLETIAAKALEKDKTRRYGSAAALAADIRRYLQNEPISARPASATYQLQKFARRHRAVVTGVVAVIVVLAAGVAGTAREAIRARRAERAAITAEQSAEAINDFLRNDVLAQASANTQAGPGARIDPDLKVRTALDRAAGSIGERFQGRPIVEASIRHTIGDTYRELGAYPESMAQLDRALELRRANLGDEHPETLESMHIRGHVLYLQAKYAEAEPIFNAVLAARTRTLGETHRETLLSLNSLAMLYYSRAEHAKAEPLLQKYVDAMRQLHGEEHRETANGLNDLAGLYKVMGKYKEAEPLYVKALAIRERVAGEESPETMATLNDLGHLYRLMNRYKEAEPLYIRSVELRRRILGNDHSETAIGVGNLGNLYLNMGDYAKAEPLLLESMQARLRIWGENHPDTANGINNVATLYGIMNRREESLPLYARALDIRRRTLGDEHRLTLQSVANLAIEYRVVGRYKEAETLLAPAVETARRVYGDGHPETVIAVKSLANIYRLQKKFALAEPLATAALEAQRQSSGNDHPDTLAAEEEVASLRLDQGRLDDALQHVSRTLPIRRRTSAPNNWVLLRVVLLKGRIHLARKEYADAEHLFRETSETEANLPREKWRRALADCFLARVLAEQGRQEEAAALLRSASQRIEAQKAAIPADSWFLYQEARRGVRPR